MTNQKQGILIAQEAAIPEPIDVGIYNAKLVSWEERENPQYGDYIRMEFEITSGESKGTLRSLVASKKLTKGYFLMIFMNLYFPTFKTPSSIVELSGVIFFPFMLIALC